MGWLNPHGGGADAMSVAATGYAISGRTATGIPVGWGVVAVDPAVIVEEMLGVVRTGGAVVLTSPTGAIVLGNLAASGNLDVTAHGGSISQAIGMTVIVDGSTGLNASIGGAPENINLTNAGNEFAQAVSASGLQVGLNASGPLILGLVDASGNLIVNATGGLDLGSSTVAGNLVADSGNGEPPHWLTSRRASSRSPI